MNVEANKRNVRRMYEEAWGEGRLEVVDECVAPGAVDHVAFRGQADFRAAVRGVIQMVRAAIPDLRHTIEDLIAEGDRVAWRVVVTGTHTGGPLFGVPAGGRPIQLEQFHIVQCDDHGRCVQHWANVAADELIRQISVDDRAEAPA